VKERISREMLAFFGNNHGHKKPQQENIPSFTSGSIFASMFTKGSAANTVITGAEGSAGIADQTTKSETLKTISSGRVDGNVIMSPRIPGGMKTARRFSRQSVF
jgi:hypothetical protein